ncbi:MAG TPA: hypothetical protein PKN64_16995 [Casimicrobium sp.]|nr:hypothetical protein [Casimicrobium sp.]
MMKQRNHRKQATVISTSDRRTLDKVWRSIGGRIEPLSGTGEVIYTHPAMNRRIRVNNRKKQTCATVLSKLNQLLRDGVTAGNMTLTGA